MVIYTYLTFNGNCREAMKFYQKCLGGKLYIQNLGIYPGAEKMPEQMKHCILQATLENKNFKLTATDLVADDGLIKGNSISLLLNCKNETEIINCYKKLSKGGKQLHPLKINFEGGLSGDLTDKYGIQWLLCYQKKILSMKKTTHIDSYILGFPEKTQKLLQQLRKTISKAAPDAREIISYGIPTFSLYGNLVHFAGYKSHIGFYPGANGIKTFQNEISIYKNAKGSVQFPIDQAMPLDLITKIVKFRISENLAQAELKKRFRTCVNGHKYYKSSECPVCPICEKERKPQQGFLSLLSAPARRALENKGINTLKELSKFTQEEIISLHGIGKTTIPKLKAELSKNKLSFKIK